ncbi:hypothetical protein BJ956_001650 [Arthrobacter psychrochitiniphilus]|nr:hypothetical protein [Arthrobacter psychrochitiniphilus]
MQRLSLYSRAEGENMQFSNNKTFSTISNISAGVYCLVASTHCTQRPLVRSGLAG